LGENNIIDISNDSAESQLSDFSPENKQTIVNCLKSEELLYDSINDDTLTEIVSVSLRLRPNMNMYLMLYIESRHSPKNQGNYVKVVSICCWSNN
jgi:hypothetical protein